MKTIRWFATRYFAILACSAGLLVAGAAHAVTSTILVSGNWTYTITGSNVTLALDRMDNLGIQESGELQLELWALPTPYFGFGQVGYEQVGVRMATYQLGRLAPRFFFAAVSSGPIPLTLPPPGNWFFVSFVTEYTGTVINDSGWQPAQFKNFPGPVAVAPPPFTTPPSGLWFDPAQPGNAYTIQINNGNAVVLTNAFLPTGLAQWYLSTGPLTNGGRTFAGTLDKYVGGPCIPCTDTRFATPMGNDGTILINFTSATTATVLLPGGRVANIVPVVP